MISQTILACINIQSESLVSRINHNAILYTTSWSALSMWFCTSRRLGRGDITRMHALHYIWLNGPMYGARNRGWAKCNRNGTTITSTSSYGQREATICLYVGVTKKRTCYTSLLFHMSKAPVYNVIVFHMSKAQSTTKLRFHMSTTLLSFHFLKSSIYHAIVLLHVESP